MKYETRTEGRERPRVNWDAVEGNWKQVKGKVKERWGKLTDDYLDEIGGRRDQLVGKIQEAYGVTREDAEAQVDTFMENNRDDLSRASATDKPEIGRAHV